MFCPKCGNEMKDGDRFCQNCGCDVNKSDGGMDAANIGVKEVTTAKQDSPIPLILCIVGIVIGVLGGFLPCYTVSFLGTALSKYCFDSDALYALVFLLVALIYTVAPKKMLLKWSVIPAVLSLVMAVFTLVEIMNLGVGTVGVGLILLIVGILVCLVGSILGFVFKQGSGKNLSDEQKKSRRIFVWLGVVIAIGGIVLATLLLQLSSDAKKKDNAVDTSAFENISSSSEKDTGENSQSNVNEWVVSNEVDEFGDIVENGTSYLKCEVTGTFSNTATQDDELNAGIAIGNGDVSFSMMQYGSLRVTGDYYDKFSIKTKVNDELKEYSLSESSSGVYRCDYDGSKYIITNLRDGKNVKCAVIMDTSQYNFEIQSNGFKEKYDTCFPNAQESVSYEDEEEDLVEDEGYEDEEYADEEYADENEEENGLDEYIFPDSDSRYLTEDEVLAKGDGELRIARNEIYARHGRRFSDKYLQEYFDGLSWYVGEIEPEDFDESVLNKFEKANAKLIKKYA